MYKILYKKSNGDIIERKRSTLPSYNIGDETSMGWTLLDIKYQYGDKYYSHQEYYNLISKSRSKRKVVKEILKVLKKYNTSITILLLIYNAYRLLV